MEGHYSFNANALGFGAALTPGAKGKRIPSMGSAVLAPTGGEGIAVKRGYHSKLISFSRLETRVQGYSDGNFHYTDATVTIEGLDLMKKLRVKSAVASLTSVKEVLDNGEAVDRKFTFHAEFDNLVANGQKYDIVLDASPFDENATYEDFCAALFQPSMADYRKLIGLDDDSTTSLVASPDRAKAIAALKGRTIRCSLLEPKSAPSGGALTIPGLGTVYLAEVLVKPGQRRLTLFRVELDAQPPARRHAAALVLADGGLAGGGSMSVGSVEGNGTQTYP
jgi:hypothetical protein